MRQYYLDPALCTVSINPKAPLDVGDIDVLVMTSPETLEDFCLVALAMADGVPVVLPRTVKTTRMVANGLTGVLYGASAELYSLVDYLVNDPMLREEIGAAARNLLGGSTDIEAAVSTLLNQELEDADAEPG